jgi:hypothetical protein
LRDDLPLAGTTLVVRGGRDSADKLRRHAERTARAWALDGQPLLGIAADDPELAKLLAALGPVRPNPKYAKSAIWREEG